MAVEAHRFPGTLAYPTNDPGKLPPFILSLLPEGWLEEVLDDKDERAALRSGKRYMSNITIAESEAELLALPADILLTRLKSFSDAGVFTGRYNGPGRTDFEASFEKNLARIYASPETPRLAGVQMKAPMFLEANGIVSPSIGKPFTHILKPAGTGGHDALSLVEWTAMMLGRSAGLTAPSVALIPMPDGMPPALLVERFDIRESPAASVIRSTEFPLPILKIRIQDTGLSMETPRLRSPLKLRPLRLPGQSLDEAIETLFWDKLGPPLLFAFILAVLAGFEWLTALTRVPPQPWLFTGFAMAASLYAVRKFAKLRGQFRHMVLGRDGERVVAEELEKLRADGAEVMCRLLDSTSTT